MSGRVSQKMAPVLRRIYDQMMEPKWVISMGACATSGGVFNNYAIVQGVDKVVPVDVYVPGCPPRPESLIEGILDPAAPHRRQRRAELARPHARAGSAGTGRRSAHRCRAARLGGASLSEYRNLIDSACPGAVVDEFEGPGDELTIEIARDRIREVASFSREPPLHSC